MRTKNLFRALVAATLAMVSVGLFGQTVTTSGTANTAKNGLVLSATATEAVDFATINSKMPYSITADPVVAAQVNGTDFLASGFSWRLSGGGALEIPGAATGLTEVFQQDDGATSYVPAAYSQNDIAVQWGAALGQYTITVAEQSRNTLGMPECDGADSTLLVYLMPVPTAEFNEAMIGHTAGGDIEGTAGDGIVGGCGLEGLVVHFAVDVTGTQDFIVNGRYRFTPFGGAAGAWTSTGAGFANDSVVATGIKNGTSGTFDGAATAWYNATPAAPLATTIDAFQFTVPSGVGTYGRYVFELYRVTDKVSRKSFQDTDGVTVGYQNPNNNGDLSAGVQQITLISLPTPTTGTIRHVGNNVAW